MLPAKTIRSAVGKTTASYPVPFLGVGGLASGILVLLIAVRQPSGSAGFWACFGLSAALFLATAAMICFTIVRRPSLLRNERTVIVGQALEIFGNDEIGDLTGERVERMVGKYLEAASRDLEGPASRKGQMWNQIDEDSNDE